MARFMTTCRALALVAACSLVGTSTAAHLHHLCLNIGISGLGMTYYDVKVMDGKAFVKRFDMTVQPPQLIDELVYDNIEEPAHAAWAQGKDFVHWLIQHNAWINTEAVSAAFWEVVNGKEHWRFVANLNNGGTTDITFTAETCLTSPAATAAPTAAPTPAAVTTAAPVTGAPVTLPPETAAPVPVTEPATAAPTDAAVPTDAPQDGGNNTIPNATTAAPTDAPDLGPISAAPTTGGSAVLVTAALGSALLAVFTA